METGERLARIEQKIEHIAAVMEAFIKAQEQRNEAYSQVRDDFMIAQASAKGAWWTVSLFGALTVTVAGAVSWVVAHFKGI